MSDAVIVALITAAATIVCQLLISAKSRKDGEAKRAAERQHVEDRLSAIEIKLDIHNGYAEKLGDIQRDIAVLATEIKNIKEAS